MISLEAAKKTYERRSTAPPWPSASSTSCRRCFNGKRIVVFSGGEAKDLDGVYEEIRGLRDGGANGSHHRPQHLPAPKEQALEMLDKIIDIYQGKM